MGTFFPDPKARAIYGGALMIGRRRIASALRPLSEPFRK
jgi:hypothetical protein